MTRRAVACVGLAMLLGILGAAPAAAQGSADLQITKVADRAKVRVGETVTYSITVTNLGPDVATDVVWGDAVPDELNLVSFTCNPPGAPLGGDAGPFCLVDTLATGASATETLVAEVAPIGIGEDRIIENTSFILSSSTIDPNSDSDQDSVSIRIIGKPR